MGLPDVFPGNSRCCLVDSARLDSELLRDCDSSSAADPIGSKLANQRLGQFGIAASLPLKGRRSFLKRSASFGAHVSIVVFSGPQEEVVRANAGRVVAAVQDTEFIWNGSMHEFPRDAVRVDDTPAPSGKGSDLDVPVAVGIECASPDPAGFSLAYFWPESTFDRLGRATPAAGRSAIMRGHHKVLSCGVRLRAVPPAPGLRSVHSVLQQAAPGFNRSRQARMPY